MGRSEVAGTGAEGLRGGWEVAGKGAEGLRGGGFGLPQKRMMYAIPPVWRLLVANHIISYIFAFSRIGRLRPEY